MVIDIKNTLSYNQLRWSLLSGNVTGIWDKNSFFLGSSSHPIMKYHYLTANFVNFEKHISKQMAEVSYHLSGYGVKFNESLVSFLGESVERYTYSLLPAVIKNRIVFKSYVDMEKEYEGDLICEWQYINTYYSQSDIANYILPEDKIRWVAMNSLNFQGKKVWMPLQFVTMYHESLFENEKRYVTSAVSTGTACHETTVKSIENALIEYLQIDSFNLWWYGGFKGKRIEIDVVKNLELWFDKQVAIDAFLEKFDVQFTDISFDKAIHVILCEIESKDQTDDMPKYTVGVQGSYSLENAIYRSFMECLTVLEYNMNVVWTNKEKFLSVTADIEHIDNLDDNVIFYAKYGRVELEESKHQLSDNPKKVKNLQELLQYLPYVSEYAAFLSITPPEFQQMNCEVNRVILPELLAIHLPSYPPYYHTRYNDLGGVVNHLPHPIA
ncbi:streptolysin associated protein SagD [Bacilli bacterium]|nr:streptolysin associated protein SagD [Bacilli bacterium]GHU42754.1 streptolysin associated protein SagD [Bacilli bacterium]